MDSHSNWIDEINQALGTQDKYLTDEYPKVSIIIPTFNCMQKIGLTLEKVMHQNYPNFEVIVVDAGSTDRTLEVIASYKSDQVVLCSVSHFQRYEMLNKGISLAQGNYFNFLFPGDFYITKNTLKTMMTHALDHSLPYLVFCATLLRNGKSDVKILYRHLTLASLKNGQQPTSLQSCWFHRDVFQKIGKFKTNFEMRGGYDLLCRYAINGHFQTISTSAALTDYDLRIITRKMIMTHFLETFKIIQRYFGAISLVKWFFKQKDFNRYMRLWWRSIQIAFSGQ